ncbi:MAG: hypothetical protein OEY96_12480 [Gammaproteobacteria bacterium]|nr:hypothetical protein [Gammaproteobacteria bacterium]
MQPEEIPLYLNWSFWAVVVAALAVLLSQIPPLHIIFRKARIEIEPYSRLALTHRVGNPNLQLHLIISNIGGRRLRVKNIEAIVSRDGSQVASLPVQNYYQTKSDTNTVLFTRFTIEPNEDWGHTVNFLNWFARDEEREYREMEGRLKADINQKRSRMAGDVTELIEADPGNVSPLQAFFKDKFIWTASEYELVIKVTTDVEKANLEQKFRFTIFEYYETELRKITDEYKYGAGIYWESNTPQTVFIDLKKA